MKATADLSSYRLTITSMKIQIIIGVLSAMLALGTFSASAAPVCASDNTAVAKDTTIHFRKDENGKNDTFVYTGDIHAMWLRDSGAQVWPYVQLVDNDPELKDMVEGVIRRQFRCINIDPYANAFNDGPTGGEWMSDLTDMVPDVHERKWEIDSFCYPVRLAYAYWKKTGDASVFDGEWLAAINRKPSPPPTTTRYAGASRCFSTPMPKQDSSTNRSMSTTPPTSHVPGSHGRTPSSANS